MKLRNIRGNTYYLNPIFIDIALYRINETECILIDTGFHKTARDELIPFMKENKLNVKGILCTHAHIDHAGGNYLLKKEFNSQIAIPSIENILCENSYNMYVLGDNLRYKEYGKTIPKYSYKTDIIIYPEYDDLYFLGVDFKIIKINGHSPYHIGYITPDNVAYLGDTIISEEMLKKTKLPYIFDIENDLNSKKMLKELKCEKYILSHEGVYENIDNLIDKNIKYINSRLDLLLELLKKPVSLDEYTAKIVDKMNISQNLRKIIYIQRAIKGYLSYFQDQDLVEVFINNNKIKFIKK